MLLTSVDLNGFEVGDGIMEGGLATFLIVNLSVDQGGNLLFLDVFHLSKLLNEVVLGLDDVIDTLLKALVLGLVDFMCNVRLLLLCIIQRPLSVLGLMTFCVGLQSAQVQELPITNCAGEQDCVQEAEQECEGSEEELENEELKDEELKDENEDELEVKDDLNLCPPCCGEFELQ